MYAKFLDMTEWFMLQIIRLAKIAWAEDIVSLQELLVFFYLLSSSNMHYLCSLLFSVSYPVNYSSLKNDVFIRRAKKADVDFIMEMFNSISSEDQKFLAYNNKASLIRQIVMHYLCSLLFSVSYPVNYSRCIRVYSYIAIFT